jgi:hypothetical protein
MRLTLTSVLALSLTLSSGAFPVVGGGAAYAQSTDTATTQQRRGATVDQLATVVEGLSARLITSVRRSKSPELGRDTDTGKTVWSSLKDLNEAAKTLANGASLRDNSFHAALGTMVSRTAATATAIEIAAPNDDGVIAAKDKLINAVGAMQANFSKARARADQGGGLSASERAKLDKIRANQKQLQARLDIVEAKVGTNTRAIEGVRQVRERSQQVSNSGNDLGDFLAAMIALRIIDGLLWGHHYQWGPWGGWYPGYNVVVIDIYQDIDIDIAYDWDDYDDALVDIDDFDLADDIDTLDEYDFDEAEEIMDEVDIDLDEDLDMIDDYDDVSDDMMDEMAFDTDGLDGDLNDEFDADLGAADLDDMDGLDDLDASDLGDDDIGGDGGFEPLLSDGLDDADDPMFDDDIGGDFAGDDLSQDDLGGDQGFDDADLSDGDFEEGGMGDGGFDDAGFDDGGFDDGGFDDGGFDDGGGDFGGDSLGDLDGGFDF